ncbi:MAG: nucleotidyltransferase family protein [Ruminococcus sp.]|nr:nucleotidyltransferase family protein [Ruminococcus sp.]
MKISAVICEFNPFHNGHKYLLDEIRKQGYDCIICIMSGSFTQRGDVAIFDKFKRTKAALKNGADLVIELPTPYAVASAQIFAKGSADIIKATSVVDKVFFGSEAGDIELLKKAAFATKSNEVEALLKEKMRDGVYYPLALEKAVNEVFGKEIADVLTSPNNTLGVEYIKELDASGIETATIKRIAVEHDSSASNGSFASASLVREMIFKGEDVTSFVPKGYFNNPAKTELGERAIMYKLKSMSLEDFENLPDISEGLHNRIYAAVKKCNSLEELLSAVKTKRYTHARLRRIITSAVLGITKDLQNTPIPYLRILGMSEKGKEALSQISKKSCLPVVTSVAQALKTLDANALKMLMCDINATDIRTVFEKEISESGADFSTAMLKG